MDVAHQSMSIERRVFHIESSTSIRCDNQLNGFVKPTVQSMSMQDITSTSRSILTRTGFIQTDHHDGTVDRMEKVSIDGIKGFKCRSLGGPYISIRGGENATRWMTVGGERRWSTTTDQVECCTNLVFLIGSVVLVEHIDSVELIARDHDHMTRVRIDHVRITTEFGNARSSKQIAILSHTQRGVCFHVGDKTFFFEVLQELECTTNNASSSRSLVGTFGISFQYESGVHVDRDWITQLQIHGTPEASQPTAFASGLAG
mmetsp:Transcript_29036/g.72968  ORF Transcript_29036/g.72968 Transcript_29036/m.72968 type:complete len:259 (+) Transcript_29036:868-1644(+)